MAVTSQVCCTAFDADRLDPATGSTASLPHHGCVSQPLRVVVASILAAIATLGLAIVASQIAVTYFLPAGDSGPATKQTHAFEPAIVGTVLASLAVLALLAHLVVILRQRTARWTWPAAVLCTLLAVGAPVIVAMLDRPTF